MDKTRTNNQPRHQPCVCNLTNPSRRPITVHKHSVHYAKENTTFGALIRHVQKFYYHSVQRSSTAKKIWLSIHPRKSWQSGDRISVRPSIRRHQRRTNVISHTFQLPATLHCTSMLQLIDSCQNRVSADQYRMAISRAQVSTHRSNDMLLVFN